MPGGHDGGDAEAGGGDGGTLTAPCDTEPHVKAVRQDILSLLQGSVGVQFQGVDVKRLTGPLVYILFRGDQPLYVGMSRRGLSRPFGVHHALAGEIEDTDLLQCWPMRSVKSALRLEGLLIESIRPLWNRRATYGTNGVRAAALLGLSKTRALVIRREAEAARRMFGRGTGARRDV